MKNVWLEGMVRQGVAVGFQPNGLSSIRIQLCGSMRYIAFDLVTFLSAVKVVDCILEEHWLPTTHQITDYIMALTTEKVGNLQIAGASMFTGVVTKSDVSDYISIYTNTLVNTHTCIYVYMKIHK